MVRYAPTLSRFESLPNTVERAICKVFEKEILYQRKLESFKPLDSDEAFDNISVKGEAINSENVANFLQSEDYEASEPELMAIIRRMDQNGDSTITRPELQEFLAPLQRDIPVRAYNRTME